MMTKIVAIDAGHGTHTPGKRTPDGEREWSFNKVVAESIIKELGNYDGVKTVRLDDPTGKTDVALTTRTNKANNAKADILVSCHHNANTGKWGNWTGTETYSYPSSANGKKLAQAIHPYVVKAYGLRDRGLKTANFHMLRESIMPAILIEGGFMDSTIDINKLRDDKVLKQAGKNIANGIVEYFGLKKKATTNKPAASKSAKKPSKANLKVDGKWGNSTTKALQKALGTVQDGFISHQLRNDVTNALYGTTVKFGNKKGGSPMVQALQRKVGVKVDGLLGPATVRALQKYLLTTQDGRLSRPSLVVKAVQRSLNEGVL